MRQMAEPSERSEPTRPLTGAEYLETLPAATLEPAAPILVRGTEALHHAVDGDARGRREFHVLVVPFPVRTPVFRAGVTVARRARPHGFSGNVRNFEEVRRPGRTGLNGKVVPDRAGLGTDREALRRGGWAP